MAITKSDIKSLGTEELKFWAIDIKNSKKYQGLLSRIEAELELRMGADRFYVFMTKNLI